MYQLPCVLWWCPTRGGGQGALPEEVDAAALAFGMRMGPFAMSDLVGLDLGIQVRS